jgi:hypothetical protein
MNSILFEIEKLSKLFISQENMKIIEDMASEIIINKNYNTEPLWALDANLNDIADLSCNFKDNSSHYPYDDEQAIYAPLQYARDEIEICNVSYSARYVIMYSLMHLEAIIRYILKNNYAFGKVRFRSIPLNRGIFKLEDLKLLPDYLIEGYHQFGELSIKFQKEANNPEFFSARDALILYTSARVLGLKTLSAAIRKDSILYIRKSDNPYFKYYIL